MSPTEPTAWEQLAHALFDEVLVPLAQDRRDRGAPGFFPLHGEDHQTTYFVEPSLRSMEATDFQPFRGDAQGLIDALIALWDEQGELDLTGLAARMAEIAAALEVESSESDGTVDVLCYTLF